MSADAGKPVMTIADPTVPADIGDDAFAAEIGACGRMGSSREDQRGG